MRQTHDSHMTAVSSAPPPTGSRVVQFSLCAVRAAAVEPRSKVKVWCGWRAAKPVSLSADAVTAAAAATAAAARCRPPPPPGVADHRRYRRRCPLLLRGPPVPSVTAPRSSCRASPRVISAETTASPERTGSPRAGDIRDPAAAIRIRPGAIRAGEPSG